MTPTARPSLPKNLPGLIEVSGGAVEWPVATLLGFVGAKAAGVQILKSLEQDLAALGIGHLPVRLPNAGKRRVLLYVQDRPGIGSVMHLTRQLATNQPTDDAETDEVVSRLATLLSAQQKAIEKAAREERA